MPEWLIGLVSKTMRFVKGTGVQIPLPPPILRIRIAKFDAQKNFAQSLEYPDWKKSFGEGRGRIRL